MTKYTHIVASGLTDMIATYRNTINAESQKRQASKSWTKPGASLQNGMGWDKCLVDDQP